MRPKQRAVTIISIIIAIISFGFYLFYRNYLHYVPLWDKVALTYGAVFCIFLAFDAAAKSVAAGHRSRSEEAERPRPQPGMKPGQAAVVAPSATPTSSVRLQRVQGNWDAYCERIDAFVHELLALDGQRPALDAATGRVQLGTVEQWAARADRHPFEIISRDQTVGCCAVELTAAGEARLLVMYVDTAWRRQHVGQSAMQQVGDFLRLTGIAQLQADISAQNHRGQRFLLDCGFRAAKTASDSGAASDAGQDGLHQHGLRQHGQHQDGLRQDVRFSLRLGGSENSI